MDGNSYMDNFNCHELGVGVRADGGIPEELARGTKGCTGLWVPQKDNSWLYTMTHLQGTLIQEELLLRRGDTSIYSNAKTTGAGSAHRAILFLLHNPNNPLESIGWNLGNDCSALEVAYRHYRDIYMGDVLNVSSGTRRICTESGQLLHFGTLTHGFARGENPGPPPIVSAP